MKHHAFGRPVGKCKGCALNLRTICAAGCDPKSQWSGGSCPSMNDLSLLAAFLNPAPVTGAKAARQVRQARAVGRIGRCNGFTAPVRASQPARSCN